MLVSNLYLTFLNRTTQSTSIQGRKDKKKIVKKYNGWRSLRDLNLIMKLLLLMFFVLNSSNAFDGNGAECIPVGYEKSLTAFMVKTKKPYQDCMNSVSKIMFTLWSFGKDFTF